jgi:glucose 1-dehydrogenase/3-oxoacyl-[acyl-carrier protein] reductase
MTPGRFVHRFALVTGGGSGIGRATVLRLAAEGARVAILDLDGSRAAETRRLVEEQGTAAPPLALEADVTRKDQVSAAVDRVRDGFAGLHLLVNCAGIVTMEPLADLPEENWDRVVDVNLKSVFLVSQAAGPLLAASGGGSIVNLSTVEADVVVSGSGRAQVHYNASKGGVKMLTKALAVELADSGIRVNCVAPGPVNTTFAGIDFTDPEVLAFMNSRLLVRRVAEPADVAAAISFLLSDDASYITGVQLPVDGGWLTR